MDRPSLPNLKPKPLQLRWVEPAAFVNIHIVPRCQTRSLCRRPAQDKSSRQSTRGVVAPGPSREIMRCASRYFLVSRASIVQISTLPRSFDGKRIMEPSSPRDRFAGSRRHDRSKEVTHGPFAPQTGQIRPELAEIDHARHQRYAVRLMQDPLPSLTNRTRWFSST